MASASLAIDKGDSQHSSVTSPLLPRNDYMSISSTKPVNSIGDISQAKIELRSSSPNLTQLGRAREGRYSGDERAYYDKVNQYQGEGDSGGSSEDRFDSDSMLSGSNGSTLRRSLSTGLLEMGSGGAAGLRSRRSRSIKDEYLLMLGYTPLIFQDKRSQEDILASSPGTLSRMSSLFAKTGGAVSTKSWVPSPGSIRGSIFNLAGATLGAGALSLPYAIAEAGLLLGLLELAFAAFLTIYTTRLLISAGEKTGLQSYEDLALYCFGEKGAMAVGICILVFCFGTSVAYLVTLGDIMHPLCTALFGADSALATRWVEMCIFCFTIMLPLSLLKDISSLQFSSILGVISTMFLIFVVAVRSVEEVVETSVSPSVHWVANVSGGVNIVLSVPIIMFAFTNQVNVFSIYTELQRPNIRRMRKVVDRAAAVALAIYLTIGVSAYVAYGDLLLDPAQKGNILLAFGIGDKLLALGRAAITFTVCVAFPLNIFPCRFTLDMMFFSESEASTTRHTVVTVTLVGLALVTAVFVPNINTIFGIVGGLCSSAVCFVVPAAYMLSLEKGPWYGRQKWTYSLLLVSAAFIGLFSTGITIWSNFFMR